MLQETNLEMALKKVLAGKRVLAAVERENAARHTFRYRQSRILILKRK